MLEAWNPSVARASIETDWACVDRSFVELRKRAGSKIENLQTFCLERVYLRDQVPVLRGNLVGYYEDCLATCDAIERELLLAFASNPPNTADVVEFDRFAKANLALRNAAKAFCVERSASPYLTGIGRSAAIAVSTLLFAKMPDRSVVTFLGQRSGKTAAHPYLMHVVPSGMFQPIWHWQNPGRSMDSQYYSTEWSLRNHVLRELAHELFGRDIHSDLARQPPETPDVIFGYPEVKYLDHLITSGKANLFVTAVLVNLLNLRPEIATVLIIDDPKWYDQHSRGTHGLPRFARSWEFLNDVKLVVWTPTQGDRSQDLRSQLGGVTSRNFVVPGAITFLLGLRFARTSHWTLKP